jgi:glycosyltransferase involved in cell wall biosynthesis
MKIAFVYDVIYPFVKGGVEKRVWELANRLSRRGHDVHLYGMKYWENNDILIREGVTLHGVCSARNLYTHGRRAIIEPIWFSIALFFHLRKEKYDLIDCQQFPYFPCFSAKIISFFKKSSFIITWHEVWGDYWYSYLGKIGFFGKIIELFTSRLTPDTITVSATTAGNLETLVKLRNHHIIPNGVDIRRINSIPPHEEKSDIIFVGRLIKEKHVDLLVHSMKILQEKRTDYQLLIIGEGPEHEAIEILVSKISLKNQVQMIGFCEHHDEVISRMKSAKVCVLPSTREGFGITAVEALACGIPVITINHPSNAIRELITEYNGRLCALSADDLATNIIEIIADYQKMRGACIASAELFDWDRIIPMLETYYQSVIKVRNQHKGA